MGDIRLNLETDILGAVDVQPTFMPGGELPVAEGDAVVPVIKSAAQPVSACLRYPGLASTRAQLVRQLPSGA